MPRLDLLSLGPSGWLPGATLQFKAQHRLTNHALSVHDAREQLWHVGRTDAADSHRRSLSRFADLVPFAAGKLRETCADKGLTLGATSSANLDAICDQAKALHRQAQEVIESAVIVTSKPERVAYLQDLHARANLPAPALPAVETKAEHV